MLCFYCSTIRRLTLNPLIVLKELIGGVMCPLHPRVLLTFGHLPAVYPGLDLDRRCDHSMIEGHVLVMRRIQDTSRIETRRHPVQHGVVAARPVLHKFIVTNNNVMVLQRLVDLNIHETTVG